MTRKLFFVLLMCLLVVPIYADVTYHSLGTFDPTQCTTENAAAALLCSGNTLSLSSGATDYFTLTFNGVPTTSGTTTVTQADLGDLTLQFYNSYTNPSDKYGMGKWDAVLDLNLVFTLPGHTVSLTDGLFLSSSSTSDSANMALSVTPSGSVTFSGGDGYNYTLTNLSFYDSLNHQSSSLAVSSSVPTNTLELRGDISKAHVPEVGSIALLGLFLGASALITRKVRA